MRLVQFSVHIYIEACFMRQCLSSAELLLQDQIVEEKHQQVVCSFVDSH